MTPPPTGRAVDLPCRICPFFDPFGSGLPKVEVEGQEPRHLDPNSVSFSWGFSVDRDASGNARPPFFAPAPAAGRSNLLDADGTRAFFEKVWHDHGRDGRIVGVLEGGKVVVASGELLLVAPSWCVVLEQEQVQSSGTAAEEPPFSDDPALLEAALEVSCPYPACRAEAGQPCKNPQSGAARSVPHPTRVSQAKTAAVEAETQDDADADGEILDPDRAVSVSRDDALGVTCPRKRCRAEPGYPCISVDGASRHPHPGRWRVAMLRKKEGLAIEDFARELNGHVMNEGRKAASQGRARTENPHGLSNQREAARRTAWDAGWIYVAGADRLRRAVEDEKMRLEGSLPVDPSAGYSIEQHGPLGQYALYFGRGPTSHGLNLCTLTDFDFGIRGEEARKAIVDALGGLRPDHRGPYKLVQVSTAEPGRFALFREGPPLDRLCTLWDFDKDGEETRRKLLEGLNGSSPLLPRSSSPLSVDCPLPLCGAKAGEPCRKLAGDGGPRTEPHPAREARAQGKPGGRA